MSTLRILLVDDHEVVRQGLSSMLEGQPGWTICGVACNGREAIQKTDELRPDVVVIDFSMPDLNGLEATRQIRRLHPSTEVLVLTMYASERLAREFLDAGARGFILKSDAGKILIDAVRTVSRHEPFFTTQISHQALQRSSQSTSDEETLTARELEIVQLVGEGRGSKEIADRLGISVHTVETHRTNIMRKLGIHSVGELVRYAIRNRIAEA